MDPYLFSGLKVLDVATVIAAPAAAMMLADFGASVIKVEAPGAGDMLRIIQDVPNEDEAAASYMWQMDGRNKRGIVLNLKTEAGMAVLHKLVADCDVFITNQPYSVRESLGLTYEALRPLKPDMIYASLTAYGENGPERSRKGFDQLAYWARSGLMDLMRAPDTVPAQGLSGMGDHPTGVALYAGIVTALLHRERTGEGGMVHTSLLANGLWSCAAIAQGVMAGGRTGEFRGNRRLPPAMYRVYQTKDERWLQFNMVRNEELLALLFAALEAPDLMSDPRFTPENMWDHRGALGDAIQAIVGTRTAEAWQAQFAQYEVPVNLVATIEEKPTDPQVLENAMAAPPADPGFGVDLLLNHPIKITSVPQVAPKPPPAMGEHTDAILAELGYDAASIAQMRADGATG